MRIMNFDKEFGVFLKEQREQKNVSQEQLAEGIFDATQIGKLETGKRYADWAYRSRLMERLGESSVDYELYLIAEEYDLWRAQEQILDALDWHKFSLAEERLERFCQTWDMGNKVVAQFASVMRLQCMELQKQPKEACFAVLFHAVKLTIPAVDTKRVSEMVLGIAELNLVLEYYRYTEPEDVLERYAELLKYMNDARFDLECRALLCPKIALYACQELGKGIKQEKNKDKCLLLAEQARDISKQGIEALRNHRKLYFAVELLELQQEILRFLITEGDGILEECQACYKQELEQNKDFLALFQALYKDWNILPETNGYTPFYRKYEIYCINDVIRARRSMFGYTRTQLEDICTSKTLKRIEDRQCKIQINLARELFERFGMSTSLERAQIVTKHQKALFLEKKLRWTMNQQKYEEAEQLLEQLKAWISMDIIINRQYVLCEESKIAYARGKLTKEGYVQQLTEALELTIPFSIAIRPLKEQEAARLRGMGESEKYLTNTEVTILYNILRVLDEEENQVYYDALKEYYIVLENKTGISSIFGMYGLVMYYIASLMGNAEKYEESNIISKRIVENSFVLRHLEYVEENLYNMMWNREKQNGFSEKENPERIPSMEQGILIDVYCKDKLSEVWMRNKLNKIYEEKED